MAKYQYYIDFGSGNVAFYPDKDAVFEWKKDGQQKGFMRRVIKELTLSRDFDNAGTFSNATVFNTLWEYYFDITKHTTKLTLEIWKDGVLDFESLFYVTDGNIDVNGGSYSIKPILDDAYRVFLEVIDDEVDIITNLSGAFINAQYTYTAKQDSYDNGSSTQSPYEKDGIVPDAWEQGTGSGCTVWYRQISLYDLGGWTKYGGLWYYGLTRLCNDSGGDDPATKIFVFPNCYKLIDSIQLIITTILAGTDYAGMIFESLFFNTAESTTVANYVTGENPNVLMNTLIEQRSDTKDPDATNKATEGKISFNTLMKELRAMFDVEWFIDSSGVLRIEHRKFFYNGLSVGGTKGICIDLTDPAKYLDPFADKMYVESTQQFSGDGARPIKKETIKFQEQESAEWWDNENYLEYDVIDYEERIKEHNVTEFSTDVSKAINDPEAISDDGFFMFNCELPSGGTAEIITKERDSSNPLTKSYANAGFSTKWLLHDYYEYGRSNKSGILHLSTGSTTGSTYSVISSLPIFTQKDIVFLLNEADDIDINQYIAVYLLKSDGSQNIINGNIIKIEHDLYDDYVKVTLGHEL